jgi:hypothetical protein
MLSPAETEALLLSLWISVVRITHASARRLALRPGMPVFAIAKSVIVDPQAQAIAPRPSFPPCWRKRNRGGKPCR